jgi:hypothetical protein
MQHKSVVIPARKSATAVFAASVGYQLLRNWPGAIETAIANIHRNGNFKTATGVEERQS